MSKQEMEQRFLKSTYLDKGTSFSCSELTKPSYQLWVSHHSEAPKEGGKLTSFKSALGSAWHKACEVENEAGVIKEFTFKKDINGVSIGGTADELMWRYSINKWQIRDHKTKGVYPAKKFLGVGTKAKPNPKPEVEKEVLQLSIYRWLFSDLFPDIDDKAVVYLWVIGHSAREQFPEYNEVWLDLLPVNIIQTYIEGKINTALADTPPAVDCEKWMCDYCNVRESCPFIKEKSGGSFGDES
jgi:hypothetical protein